MEHVIFEQIKNRFLEYEEAPEKQAEYDADSGNLGVNDATVLEMEEQRSAVTEVTDRATGPSKEIVLVNINEIVAASELEALLNVFLLSMRDHTLVIQCNNNDQEAFLHNLHIQYLVEKARHMAIQHGKENEKRLPHKQVIVLLYMCRIDHTMMYRHAQRSGYSSGYLSGSSSSSHSWSAPSINAQQIQSQQFPLIFNLEWQHIYCDALLPSELSVTDVNIHVPHMSQKFEERISKHAESVIISTFELALNHIRYVNRVVCGTVRCCTVKCCDVATRVLPSGSHVLIFAAWKSLSFSKSTDSQNFGK